MCVCVGVCMHARKHAHLSSPLIRISVTCTQRILTGVVKCKSITGESEEISILDFPLTIQNYKILAQELYIALFSTEFL